MASRLNGYTLKVLAKDHKTVVYSQAKNQAPAVSVTHEIGIEDPQRVVRRAAMTALPLTSRQILQSSPFSS